MNGPFQRGQIVRFTSPILQSMAGVAMAGNDKTTLLFLSGRNPLKYRVVWEDNRLIRPAGEVKISEDVFTAAVDYLTANEDAPADTISRNLLTHLRKGGAK